MKWIFIFIAAAFLVACTDKTDDSNVKRMVDHEARYKTPPVVDRKPVNNSGDRGF
jgi:hypothetical protein